MRYVNERNGIVAKQYKTKYEDTVEIAKGYGSGGYHLGIPSISGITVSFNRLEVNLNNDGKSDYATVYFWLNQELVTTVYTDISVAYNMNQWVEPEDRDTISDYRETEV